MIASRFGARGQDPLKLTADLATGTGRLLTSLSPFGTTTALDGSEAMLQTARNRNLTGVEFIEGDVFNCPLRDKFHVVTCGRLLRHLEYPDRQLLYHRFQELLREDGIAIVRSAESSQGISAARHCRMGKISGLYDVFWTLSEFRGELIDNGFRLVDFVSVGANISLQPDQPPTAEPVEYLVAFEKTSTSPDLR